VDALKDKTYKTNPHILEQPKNNVRPEISAITGEELHRVDSNVFRRYTECIRSGGQHFQYLLQHWSVLLHFLKVIFPAIADRRAKATFTDCYPCRLVAGQGQTGRPRHSLSVKQEEILPVE
jgi:hypothetical protein